MNCPTCGLLNSPLAQTCIHCKSPIEQVHRPVIARGNVVELNRAQSGAAAAARVAQNEAPAWREQLNVKLERLKEKNEANPVSQQSVPSADFRQREFIRPSSASALDLDSVAQDVPRREYHPLAEKALLKIDRAKPPAADSNILEIPIEDENPDLPSPTEADSSPKPKRAQSKNTKTERIEISLNQPMLPFELGSTIALQEDELASTGVLTAPLSARIRAGAIDALFVFGCFLIFLLIIFFVPQFAFLTRASLLGLGAILLLILVSYIGLFTWVGSRTLGMDHEELEILGFQGTKITGAEARLRTFGCLVSLGCFGLGYLWAVFDPDGLTWHDMISRTLIVEKSSIPPNPLEAVGE